MVEGGKWIIQVRDDASLDRVLAQEGAEIRMTP